VRLALHAVVIREGQVSAIVIDSTRGQGGTIQGRLTED